MATRTPLPKSGLKFLRKPMKVFCFLMAENSNAYSFLVILDVNTALQDSEVDIQWQPIGWAQT